MPTVKVSTIRRDLIPMSSTGKMGSPVTTGAGGARVTPVPARAAGAIFEATISAARVVGGMETFAAAVSAMRFPAISARTGTTVNAVAARAAIAVPV